MKKNTLIYPLVTISSFFPVFAQAQAFRGLKSLLASIGGLINTIIPVLFALWLVYFFWGLSQFILHDAGNDKTREEGKKKMLWGIVALFVFAAIFGILTLIGGTLNISTGGTGNGIFNLVK